MRHATGHRRQASRNGLLGTGLLLVAFLILASAFSGCSGDATGLDERRVGPAGGTASLAGGAVTLSVPPGALDEEVWFTAAATTLFPASELLVAGTTFEVGPPGTGFVWPATLTLAYDPGQLPEGVGESGLGLYQVIGTEWVLLDELSVSPSTRTVSGKIRTLGRVGILALPVEAVDVSCPSSVLAPGASLQLSVVARAPNGAALTDRRVTWVSSDESVATVDAGGVLTGIAEGTVTVTAEVGGESGEAELRVAVPVAGVEVTPSIASLVVGQTLQLEATPLDVYGEELPGRTVDWSSSHTGVVTVDSDGKVTAVAMGSAVVTASVEGVSGSVSLTVHSDLGVLTGSLADGVVGSGYSQTLAATGGDGTYAWSVSQGSLPGGLSLTSSTGAISGTPTSEGTGAFTVQVLSANHTATRALSITVTPVPVASVQVTPSSGNLTPGGTLQLTATALDASGGPVSGRTVTWSSSNAAAATVSGTGVVTAVASGTAMITAAVGGQAAWSAISVHDELTIGAGELEVAIVGTEYEQALTAAGGDGRNAWWVSAGTLPAGLALNATTGVIAGTPTADGTNTFTASVTSGDGQTASREMTLTVHDALEVTTASLPAGVVGGSYGQTLEASGGDGEYTWSVKEGALPLGLGLNESTGLISGTPSEEGTGAFQVEVQSGDGQEATKSLTILVSPVPVASVDVTPSSATVISGATVLLVATPRSSAGNPLSGRTVSWTSSNTGVARVATNGLVEGVAVGSATITATVEGKSAISTVTVYGALAVSTGSLAAGSAGAAYNQTLAATGGNGSYTWSLASGSLPAGLSLVPSTGVISGNPTTAGTASFTLKVTSGDGQTATKDLSIQISPL